MEPYLFQGILSHQQTLKNLCCFWNSNKWKFNKVRVFLIWVKLFHVNIRNYLLVAAEVTSDNLYPLLFVSHKIYKRFLVYIKLFLKLVNKGQVLLMLFSTHLSLSLSVGVYCI